jgi:hypothetical protein
MARTLRRVEAASFSSRAAKHCSYGPLLNMSLWFNQYIVDLILDFDVSQVVLMKTCTALSFCSRNIRSYWEGTDGCTANQERKRKETITLFATRQIGFGQILVGKL